MLPSVDKILQQNCFHPRELSFSSGWGIDCVAGLVALSGQAFPETQSIKINLQQYVQISIRRYGFHLMR
ncbi:hypothetical protein HG15A2_15120 [Adhaeretor mobilis]|uniref:Uncharacterized protein n=1 Tax=Adhaeretor mobilis TaxID=1930276 RepID=A0A517MTN1_9BACT|nr:hypothetical protein HG15A2_15120 [Adhaeretor mobilis]